MPRAGRTIIALAALALAPATAAAEPVEFPHGTVDQQFTTTQPGTPSGYEYEARYHAAGDTTGDPPYMRRMITYSPPGTVIDTGALPQCTATDVELALRGGDACPPESKLGEGEAEGKFMGFPSTLALEVFNNANEQVMVVRTPMWATVARGTVHPDASVEYASPTCYPAVTPPGCPVDTALQLGARMSAPAHAGYLTTPPTCPRSGYWQTPIRFWWADGTEDTAVTQQPCRGRRR